MMEKNNSTDKYLNTLKAEIENQPDSIQYNSKISAFLINQGRTNEAIPYLLKLLELTTDEEEARRIVSKHILEDENAALSDDESHDDNKTPGHVYSAEEIDEALKRVDSIQVIEEDFRIPDFKEALFENVKLNPNHHVVSRQIFDTSRKVQQNTQPTQSIIVTKNVGESISVGNDIRISVLDVGERSVRLRVKVPKNIKMNQDYAYADIKDQNSQAVKTSRTTLQVLLSEKKGKLF